MADTDHRLLKAQRNEVLILVKQADLDPMDFAWEESEQPEDGATLRFHRLVHKPSSYACIFGKGFVEYSPGPNSQESFEMHPDWIDRLAGVNRWLSYLKREVETPDLWASLAQEKEMLGAEPVEAVNTTFNAEEQVQIKQAIEEIRVYISATYSLASEPLATVNRKLDYLIDASKRLGRIDWKNIFVAALITLALERVIPSGSGLRELFGFAGNLLRHVLSGVISPPLLH